MGRTVTRGRHVTISEARARLGEITSEVTRKGRRYIVTRAGQPVALIMSVDEFEGMQETIDILSDPQAMQGIRQGERDIRAGRVYRWEDVKARLRS